MLMDQLGKKENVYLLVILGVKYLELSVHFHSSTCQKLCTNMQTLVCTKTELRIQNARKPIGF